jgi:pimeloyl-ACP methyl ester carboxylesterase
MYADIHGLKMFYEIHGASGTGTVPVVLLHGAISATGTSFGPLPDLLAQTLQVIAVEQQGHGRTANIDRRLSVQAMADDTLALLASLGIGRADLVGYSLCAGIALNIITSQPAVVRKAVLASVAFGKTGLHPAKPGAPESPEPADARGNDLQDPFEREYRALAPDPDHWPALLAKVQAMELARDHAAGHLRDRHPHHADHRRQRHRHARVRDSDVPAARRRSARRPGPPCLPPSLPSCQAPRTSGSPAGPACS